MFISLLACLLLVAAAASNERMYAYMTTRNAENTVQRRHAFALLQDGTLTKRFTEKIEQWRQGGQGDALWKFRGNLKFASPALRVKTVNGLYDLVMKYNALTEEHFSARGKSAPANHLIVMREKFGPDFPSDFRPTQNELNAIHDQFAALSGTGVADGTKWSEIWGNRSLVSESIFSILEEINTHIHSIEALQAWSTRTRFSFNSIKLEGPNQYEPFLAEDYDEKRFKLGLEMGGFYLAYARTGKNLHHIMENENLSLLEDGIRAEFQTGFISNTYVVWTQGYQPETDLKAQFQTWWLENNITGRFGCKLINIYGTTDVFRYT